MLQKIRIVLIEPAERMTMAAANALLKTLEEPSGKTVIMLVTTRPRSLPATVRSRCQRLDIGSNASARNFLHACAEPILTWPSATRLAIV